MFRILKTVDDLLMAKDTLIKCPIIACDLESDGLDTQKAKIQGIGIGTSEFRYFIPFSNKTELNYITAFLADVFDKKQVIFHNAKYDLKLMLYNKLPIPKQFHDTMIMSWLLDENNQHGLKPLVKLIFGRESKKWTDLNTEIDLFRGEEQIMEELAEYCCEDIANTFDLFNYFYPQLEKEGVLIDYERVELKMILVLIKMEMRGIKVDVSWLQKKQEEAKKELEYLEKTIIEKVKEYTPDRNLLINIRSPKQIEIILFDILQYTSTKETEGKKRSTDNEVLEEIIKKNKLKDDDIVSMLLKFRDLDKIYGTYLLALVEHAGLENTIHTNFMQHGTRTGRLASNEPNLQNIPTRNDRWNIRSAFIARKGYKFIIADYSQIELRMLAHYSRDKIMTDTFLNDGDIHSRTMELTGITDRRAAKGVNFGIVYGIGPRTLAKMINTKEDKAKDYINAFFKAYPETKPFISRVQQQTFRTGYVQMITGRKRHFHEIQDRRWFNTIARESINTKIQGCLQKDTYILDKYRGYVHISDLVGQKISIWDGKEFVKALIVNSGKKQKVEITFWNGQKIICSPNHKFLVTQTNGVEIWKSALEIRNLSNVHVNLGASFISIDWQSHFVKFKEENIIKYKYAPKGVWNTKKVSINKLEWNFQIGEILGRLASDGSVGKKNVCWLFAEHEYCIKEDFKIALKTIGKVREVKIVREGKKEMTAFYIDSVLLAKQLFNSKVKTEIPSQIFSNQQVLWGYLRGMFDGDGGVSGDKIVLTFGQGSKRIDWARQVQQGLLLFGIQSRVKSYKDRTVVVIRKRDNKLFLEIIGFINENKNKKLKSILVNHKELKTYGRVERVKSVKVYKEKIEMYDVINSESGRFMANGLIVHNSSADLIKIAMIRLMPLLKNLDAHMLVQIHDEIIVEAPLDKIKEVKKIIKNTMEHALVLRVPLKVGIIEGERWVKE